MNQFFKKLNEPFPETDSPRENFRNVIFVGIFITLFLYFFQVGGMHHYNGNVFGICVVFGIITIVVAILYDWFIEKILKLNRSDPSWTLLRWLIYMFTLLILISIANYTFYTFLDPEPVNWYSFYLIVLNTMMVGLFPVVFSGLLIQIKANNTNQIQAANLQTHLPIQEIHQETIQLFSNKKNQNFEAPTNDIFYMEAMQNYVSVCFLKEDKIQKEMLRNTIKNVEAQLEHTPLMRCHRSYIVNLDLIENVKGNAQGLRLSLKNLEDVEVPVSRKYIPLLRKMIES